jgi:hypothetical protein
MPANNTSKMFYVDTISITTGNSGSSDGYLNGASPNFDCDETPGKRERQMDMLTWAMAKAAEAENIEVFAVGFGVCDPDNTGTLGSASNPTYTQAQCEAQIGNTDDDDIGDERLLKCLASSTDNTNDHYFYAANASALPTIFTTIAQQIAHRLVE